VTFDVGYIHDRMITRWNATTKKVLNARETIDVCLPYPSRARSMKMWIEPDTPNIC